MRQFTDKQTSPPRTIHAEHATIAKSQIGTLGDRKGERDTDSGKQFLKFCGTRDAADGLYHGELWFADSEDDTLAPFSMSAILGDAAAEVEPPTPTLFDQEE